MTLTEFLLARIAEEEEWVQHPLFAPIVSARMLANCDAKRQIVEGHTCAFPFVTGDGRIQEPWELLALAAIYAGHPDYRDEWKP